MKIYTKRGDTGQTDLFGGGRVSKSHIRVKAYGDIDGANTAIGLAYSTPSVSALMKSRLMWIMKLMFSAGAEIATQPKDSAALLLEKHLKNYIHSHHIERLEHDIDRMEEELCPLRNFILPCGSDLSARLQFARTMVRKAEVSLIELAERQEAIRPEIIRFFNRLSDYLFVLARLANKENLIEDIVWSGKLTDDDLPPGR